MQCHLAVGSTFDGQQRLKHGHRIGIGYLLLDDDLQFFPETRGRSREETSAFRCERETPIGTLGADAEARKPAQQAAEMQRR